DIAEGVLAFARAAGADRAHDTRAEPEALAADSAGKGSFDVLLECSGAEPALRAGIAALRPRGVVVQLGLSGDMSLPMMALTAKEIDLRGSFRFHEEFATAVGHMRRGLIDVSPLLTHSFPLTAFGEAFETASDRSRSMKVQLDLAAV
ncbi:MAG: zinc-binding dehydrogenase, partial [Pseudomonadota bacterium]